jgi:pectate lyase
LGHVHPQINEAKIVASYHQTSRYHHLPLAQMQAAVTLIEAGGEFAETGREFLRWASEDLKVYARRCYDSKTGRFVAVMTDGTPLRWKEARSGYYVPESFAPQEPDGYLLWAYAMAYRLTTEEAHWETARQLAAGLGLGEWGGPRGERRSLDLETDRDDWRLIYALLEFHRATEDRQFLHLAGRVAENMIEAQAASGFFPREGRKYARTGDEAPLAILHLAAAIEGKADLMPPPAFDRRFLHCEYDGPLEEYQQKRADKRTYDHLVFYGSD